MKNKEKKKHKRRKIREDHFNGILKRGVITTEEENFEALLGMELVDDPLQGPGILLSVSILGEAENQP